MAAVQVRVCGTRDLSAADRRQLVGLWDSGFAGTFSAEDAEHCWGGRHVLAVCGGTVLAHAAVVERTLHAGDVPHRVGYVEGVATLPNRQREGLGRLVMTEVATLVAGRHPFGALSATETGFYERLGWRVWRGPTSVLRQDGTVVATPDDDGGVMVLLTAASRALDLSAPLRCEDRPGDPW